MDKVIERLNQKGSVYLWIYTENERNYAGWNISFDAEGLSFMEELLILMKNSEWPSRKLIVATTPTHKILKMVNNRQGDAKYKVATSLLLKYNNHDKYKDVWTIEHNESTLVLTMGEMKLNELLQELKMRHLEYSIADSKSGNILNIWNL